MTKKLIGLFCMGLLLLVLAACEEKSTEKKETEKTEVNTEAITEKEEPTVTKPVEEKPVVEKPSENNELDLTLDVNISTDEKAPKKAIVETVPVDLQETNTLSAEEFAQQAKAITFYDILAFSESPETRTKLVDSYVYILQDKDGRINLFDRITKDMGTVAGGNIDEMEFTFSITNPEVEAFEIEDMTNLYRSIIYINYMFLDEAGKETVVKDERYVYYKEYNNRVYIVGLTINSIQPNNK